jgi:Zn-dependent peptidase ImmA (M78 family)
VPKTRKPEIFVMPPHLKWDFIREQAELFRKKYVNSADQLPVPMEKIVEIDLRLQIIPIIGLQNKIDIDAFLTNDLKSICLDYELFIDPRRSSRLRFTLAHEVGHLILHKNEIQQCNFRTPEDWIHFREDFLEEDLNWFESQANEFAGRLLVPKEALKVQIENQRPKIDEFKKYCSEKFELSEAVARIICDKFGVSWQVIQKRIEKEKIRL